MSSAAQMLANRANAQHSTGPRTEEGKQQSARNSTNHGLCARQVVVLPGEEDAFAAHLEGLSADLQPAGALEDVVFQQIVHASWKLRRCRIAEAQLFAQSFDPDLDPLLDDTNEAKLRRLDLYARRAQSSFHSAVKELRALQTERQYREEAIPLPPAGSGEAGIEGVSPLVCYRSFLPRLQADNRRGQKASLHACLNTPPPRIAAA
jgi:hypothetical protein